MTGLGMLHSDIGDWASEGQFAAVALGLVMMRISPNDAEVGLALEIGLTDAAGDSVTSSQLACHSVSGALRKPTQRCVPKPTFFRI